MIHSKRAWKLRYAGLLCAAMIAIAGCTAKGEGGTGPQQPGQPPAAVEQPPEPVEISIRAGAEDEEFDRTVRQPIVKKFPYVTVTKVGPETTLQELAVANRLPDMMQHAYTNMAQITEIDYPLDLDELVKQHQVDLNRFDAAIIADIRNSSDGKLFLYPFLLQPFVLHYNKDIFDKFGVAYPQAGNTWDDLIALSERVSRLDGGVSYRGLVAGSNLNRLQLQLSLPLVDAQTNRSVVGSTPGWSRLLDTIVKVYRVPGNLPEGVSHFNGVQAFLNERNLAMFPHIVLLMNAGFEESVKRGLNAGITTYPVFADRPGVGTGLFGGGFAISQTTPHRELAFQIARHLASDEVQMELAPLGIVTPLVNSAVQQKLYEGYAYAKDMDISAVFQTRVAPSYAKTAFDAKAMSLISGSLGALIKGELDVNTALRQADEAINKMVQEELRK